MRFDEIATSVRDALEARRVYGEPYEKDGVTVIPAAIVSGGGGGGGGHRADGEEGGGGGFGLNERPAGAYIVKDRTVRWRPAIDVNRIVTTVGVVAVVYLFTRARRPKARAHSAR